VWGPLRPPPLVLLLVLERRLVWVPVQLLLLDRRQALVLLLGLVLLPHAVWVVQLVWVLRPQWGLPLLLPQALLRVLVRRLVWEPVLPLAWAQQLELVRPQQWGRPQVLVLAVQLAWALQQR
jgi:hypothetical protein